MKNIFFLIVILFIGLRATAQTQTPPEIEWQRCYGGLENDGISDSNSWLPNETALANGNIVVLDDGNMVFGTVSGLSVDWNSPTSTGTGEVAPIPANTITQTIDWIVKVSPTSEIIWKKHLTPSIHLQFIAKTPDGGFLISGNKILNASSQGSDSGD